MDDLDRPLTKREWKQLQQEQEDKKIRGRRKVGLVVLALIVLCVLGYFVLQFLACGMMPAGCH